MAAKNKNDEIQTVEGTASEKMNNEEVKTPAQETDGIQTGENTEARPEKEMVRFRLFQDNDKYTAPVFVGVNGVGYLVKRGEMVEMPTAVYEVLENSEKQISEAGRIMKAAEYME